MNDSMQPASGKPASRGDFLLLRRLRISLDWLPESRRSLLDYGCGNGAQTLLFASDFEQLVGVDITESSLVEFQREAEALGLADRVHLHVSAGETIPLDDDSVDCVVCFEVLEHVSNEASVLSEIHRVLHPNGILIMSVPNRWWIFETHGANLPGLPWNRVPFFSWLPKKIHDRWARARIYRRREIVSLLESSGFQVENAKYMTAPMDMLKWSLMRDWLRKTVLSTDTTNMPCFATSVVLRARKMIAGIPD